MHPPEIVLPETKPETEWVAGRALRKVSSTWEHGRLQFALTGLFDKWSKGRGDVSPEWRFRVPVPGEATRPLVPDVAYLSHERSTNFDLSELSTPLAAPDVAVEILSPRDEPGDVAAKIATYLKAGTKLIVIVDPKTRSIRLHDCDGTVELTSRDTFAHRAVPGLQFQIGEFFNAALSRE